MWTDDARSNFTQPNNTLYTPGTKTTADVIRYLGVLAFLCLCSVTFHEPWWDGLQWGSGLLWRMPYIK